MKIFKTIALFSLVFYFSFDAFAQQRQIKIEGEVYAEVDQKPLESATVYIENPKDSTLISYSITDEKGQFSLQEYSSLKQVRLKISFVGFNSISKLIEVKDTEIQLDRFFLSENSSVLSAVELTSERAPVQIRKDTIEFNANAFKTKKDATVEDLLKKLPGVEIDKDGVITVNGTEVKKIMVNGKTFFGDDPTIATKNLTKDMIESVQISDSKTKDQAFTGDKGNPDEKMINLTIKKEKNKGDFGRIAAGLGTDKRYEAAGLYNHFDNDQRISVLAGQNNINSPGFSFGELYKMYGGGFLNRTGPSSSSNSGITVSRSLGLNFVDKIGEKTDFTLSYFHSGLDKEDSSRSETQSSLRDEVYESAARSRSTNLNNSHNLKLEFEIQPDTTWLLNIQPRFNVMHRESTWSQNSKTLTEAEEFSNASDYNTETETDGYGIENKFTATKKYNAKGDFLKFYYQTKLDNFEKESLQKSFLSTDASMDSINQRLTTDGQEVSHRPKLQWRQALKPKNMFFELSYALNYFKETNKKSTYGFDESDGDYTDFRSEYSSDFDFTSISHQPMAGLIIRKESKSELKIEAGLNSRLMENNERLLSGSSFSKSYLTPSVSVNYWKRKGRKGTKYFGVQYYSEAPELFYLQSYTDVSNPSRITVGNPDLKPSHELYSYAGFHFKTTEKGLSGGLFSSFQYTTDAIVSENVFDDDFIQNQSYTNEDGVYQAYISFRMNKKVRLDSLSNLKFKVRLRSNLDNDLGYFDGELVENHKQNYSPTFRVELDYKDQFNIEPSYSLNYSESNYKNEGFRDQTSLFHEFGLDLSWDITSRLEWENRLTYAYNPSVASSFQNDAYIWNSTLNYSMFKDKAILSVKAYDLLNQNTNATQSIGDNFVRNSRSLVLKRYIMLSFSWKFNTLGAKGKTGKFRHHF